MKKRLELEKRLEKYEERYSVLEKETERRIIEFQTSPKNSISQQRSSVKTSLKKSLNFEEIPELTESPRKVKRLQNIRQMKLRIPDLNMEAITKRIKDKVESAKLPLNKKGKNSHVSSSLNKLSCSEFVKKNSKKDESLSQDGSPTFRSEKKRAPGHVADSEISTAMNLELMDKKCVLCSQKLHPVFEELHCLEFENSTLR